jgi:hypothetical protein
MGRERGFGGCISDQHFRIALGGTWISLTGGRLGKRAGDPVYRDSPGCGGGVLGGEQEGGGFPPLRWLGRAPCCM